MSTTGGRSASAENGTPIGEGGGPPAQRRSHICNVGEGGGPPAQRRSHICKHDHRGEISQRSAAVTFAMRHQPLLNKGLLMIRPILQEAQQEPSA